MNKQYYFRGIDKSVRLCEKKWSGYNWILYRINICDFVALSNQIFLILKATLPLSHIGPITRPCIMWLLFYFIIWNMTWKGNVLLTSTMWHKRNKNRWRPWKKPHWKILVISSGVEKNSLRQVHWSQRRIIWGNQNFLVIKNY